MTSEQYKFFELLSNYPRLSFYWDEKERSCDVTALKKGMKTMSHGEVILAKFFMSVWFGKNESFDLIVASSILGEKERTIISSWFLNPFRP